MTERQRQYAEYAERLNRVRLARAQALFSPLQRHLFNLIPLLLHQHHSRLPGYNSPLTPCGVKGFQLSVELKESLVTLTLPQLEDTLHASPVLEGVYVMGSTASFGQNPKSDVDVWLVYDAGLTLEEVELLRDKSLKLTQWFAGFQFEVNFYLVHPRQFCRDDTCYQDAEWELLGHEHSGSAQHWLLLEEFYRSHIRLAGKTVAWWPNAEPCSDFLFLGDVHQLPANEYFGASLWQLYKGLDKPHKALLKVLLLEAYASNYPQTNLVSEWVWLRTLAGDFSNANDAYLLLYQYIESYLLKVGDERRLEIVRRCFYLKCGIRLSDVEQCHDWRYHKLKQLVEQWEWPQSLLITLDDCEHWHSGQLQWFNAQLNELMLASYQTLLHFASTHRLSEYFKVEDLGLLTRKLHTYFSEDKQQILRLNRLWSQSLAEPNLTIVRSEQDGRCHLYRLSPEPRQFMGEVAIYQADDAASLMIWACLNGVATANSRWFEYRAGRLRCRRLNQVAERLLPYTEDKKWRVSKLDLCQPWHYRKLVWILNLEQDPSEHWQGQSLMLELMGSNLLATGKPAASLLGSVQLMSLNSWGEWHCHSFSGEQALLEAIAFATPGMRRAPQQVAFDVVSASQKLQSQLEQTVVDILKQVHRLIKDACPSKTLVQPLQLGEKKYGLFFDAKGMSYRDLSDVKSLYRQLARGELQSLPRPELANDPWVKVPEVIQNYAVKGVIQYFLRSREDELDVFVLDEGNGLSHYVHSNPDVSELVNTVTQHYAFGEVLNLKNQFNFPQFFRLVRQSGNLDVVPFGVTARAAQTEF
ncbi:class I adenylate cyclase [Shewanella indica]|uniref:class I adenylate cyclase n=1 Tax=Shewanella indica TaxID=768528 RepID=UPI00313DCEF1